MASYLGGAAAYEFYYRYLDVQPEMSWSEVAFLGFYPLAFVAFLLLLRGRVRKLTAGMWLDRIAGAVFIGLGLRLIVAR